MALADLTRSYPWRTAVWWRMVVALAGAAILAPGHASGSEAEVVARVNGEPVSRAELQRMRANPLTLQQAREEIGVQEPPADGLDRLAIKRLNHRRLMIQEAPRRKITVTERELDDAIVSLRRRFPDLVTFGAWMREQGLDERSLFESVRADMTADRVWAALVRDVRASDQQVRRYYELHRGELTREEVRLRVIAVQDEAAAQRVVAALRKGADFGHLARQWSAGLRAAEGGDSGWVRSETLQSPLREAVAPLQEGQARGPLRRGQDLLIVRLEGRRSSTRTLEEARPEIERRLLPAGRQEAVQAWLAKQERTSKIETFTAGLHSSRAPR
jgi:hypothetical protein